MASMLDVSRRFLHLSSCLVVHGTTKPTMHLFWCRSARSITTEKEQRRDVPPYDNHVYMKHFQKLGLQGECSQEELRAAFLNLAKKHHPDSNSPEANVQKFQEIECAYRVLQEKFDSEKQGAAVDQVVKKTPDDTKFKEDEIGIQDLALFHYANTCPGIGQGTPAQREKQYQRFKVETAVENIYHHRVSKIPNKDEGSLTIQEVNASKTIKTKIGIDRLVEDLIQESMAKGEFANLKGAGKPLQYQNHNPFIDMVTHKINQVLIDNGFAPQWVTLEKEIRSDIDGLKLRLKEGRRRLGALPLNASDTQSWKQHLESLLDDVIIINKKINDYNLIVPLLHKQMVHVSLHRLSEKCLKEEPCKLDSEPDMKANGNSRLVRRLAATDSPSGFLFGFFSSVKKLAD